MATKVYYVHGNQAASKGYRFGVRGIAPDTGEFKGGTAPAKRFFNYGLLTEGEFSVMLTREMLKLKQAAYSDPKGIYQQGINVADNLLRQGLHRAPTSFTGVIPKELNKVFTKFKKAQKRAIPAGKLLELRDNVRTRIGMGFDPEASPIQTEPCQQYLNFNTLPPTQLPGYNPCIAQNADINALNEHFPDSGHHVLYNYAPSVNFANAYAGDKLRDHRLLISFLSQNTALSKSNLDDWARYGVALNNFRAGLQPFEPEETIELGRTIAATKAAGLDTENERIGLLILGLTVGAFVTQVIVPLATIISGAVLKAKSLKQAKPALQNDPALKYMGLPEFGPEWDNDFDGEITQAEINQILIQNGIDPNTVPNGTFTPGFIDENNNGIPDVNEDDDPNNDIKIKEEGESNILPILGLGVGLLLLSK